MHYDELILACIECIQSFDPSIEGPDSFADKFLKKKTKDTNERMFIKQVFYGILRYRDFLKILTEKLFTSKPASTERKDETLFFIIGYLTIFRLDELPLDDYKQLIMSQDSVKINEFYTFTFDENVLKNQLREEWIKHFDFNYVDTKIIGGLLKTAENINDLIQFMLNKAKVGNISALKDSTTAQTKEVKAPKRITVPEPFNLTKSKPRVFQEPIQISNQFVRKQLPLADYKKTSLKQIEEQREESRKLEKQKTLEKYADTKLPELHSLKRPTNIGRLIEESKAKLQETLQFDAKYVTPLMDFSNIKADVHYNETAIIREEYLINSKLKEEEEKLKQILIEKKDSKEYERWVREMKEKDDIIKMEKIQKRKIELEMNREVATNYHEQRIKQNKLKAAQHKAKAAIEIQKKNEEKQMELEEKRQLVKEIDQEKENIVKEKDKQVQKNKELYAQQQAEYDELNLISKEEKRIENERRKELIRQIRELEKLPIKRTKGFDPTETTGLGLLEEMSLVELRERLEIQKKMLAEEMESKREENKLKMEERTEILVEKANVIADHRDKLRNQKEVERKEKKETKKAKEKLMQDIHEKSLFEVKNKIETKKEKIRREDEIFEKKIREIKLQRQFLQLGRAAVEEKAFKMIEDGLERKINDRQNQDLIDQQKKETVQWNDVKLRYQAAKDDVNQKTNLLQTYQKVYEETKLINDKCILEDKTFKKDIYDKERTLMEYRTQALKERNKISDSLQTATLRKKEATKKSEAKPQPKPKTPVQPVISTLSQDKIQEKEGDEEKEENNSILNKLEIEKEAERIKNQKLKKAVLA